MDKEVIEIEVRPEMDLDKFADAVLSKLEGLFTHLQKREQADINVMLTALFEMDSFFAAHPLGQYKVKFKLRELDIMAVNNGDMITLWKRNQWFARMAAVKYRGQDISHARTAKTMLRFVYETFSYGDTDSTNSWVDRLFGGKYVQR